MGRTWLILVVALAAMGCKGGATSEGDVDTDSACSPGDVQICVLEDCVDASRSCTPSGYWLSCTCNDPCSGCREGESHPCPDYLLPPGCCGGTEECFTIDGRCGFWSNSCECEMWGCDADTDPDAPDDVIEDPDVSDVPRDELDALDLDVTDTTDLDDLDGDGGEG